MCRKPYFLISFVLVLGLSGTVQAANPIDVNNPSFEIGSDGNQVCGHQGLGVGWEEGGSGFIGVDTFCPYATCTPGHCHNWPGSDDPCGVVFCYIQNDGSSYIYQVLDMNNSDANAVIEAGRMYKLTVDSLTEKIAPSTITSSFFYGDNPDANELASRTHTLEIKQRPMEDCTDPVPDPGPTVDYCRDWNYDLTLKFVAEASGDYIGKVLGIKFAAPRDDNYNFVDNVRLDWDYATYAYDPYPEDGETGVPKNVTLNWKSGTYTHAVNGHLVFFGTSYAEVYDANTNTVGIYKGAQNVDVNSYSLGTLVLGKSYYWRIDEVNSAHTTPPPPVGPWKGDVWSFEIAGYATDPSPYNGEADVPYLDQSLSWTAGTEATSHDIYFGTDEEAVADANTNSPEHKGNQVLGNTDWALPAITVDTTYYWRIDERSAVHPTGLKGKVWSFTVGQFLILDDFDQYVNIDGLYTVWDDYWLNNSDAIIALQTGDMNYIQGGEGKSMQVEIDNTTKDGPDFRGSLVDAQDMTELEAGGDWTIGGVKALTLYLIGDPCNRPHVGVDSKDNPLIEIIAPWVEVEDTSSNIGFVAYDSPTDMFYDYQWFEWNIDCNIFDACGVTLSAIDRLTIGFGGYRAGQGTTPTKNTKAYVHIDDLRLYPARCIAELAKVAGNITEEDCTIDNFDMQIMAKDWLIPDGCFPTSTANAAITMKAGAGDPNWSTGHFNNALGFDPNIEVDVCNPGLMGLSNMSITAWVRREGQPLESYIGIVTCREKTIEDSTELGCGSSKKSPTVGYCWNQIDKTWQFSSGIPIPDETWTFMAMSVDPTGATLYGGPAGGTLASARQSIELGPLKQFDHRFWIGRGRADKRYFTGKIDDVRIFADTLDAYEMEWLFTDGVDGNDPCCPAYHYKLDESSGLSAADDGCGAIVYRPPMSPANLIDPEPMNERFVNFRDFDIMATNWLEEYLWPPQ